MPLHLPLNHPIPCKLPESRCRRPPPLVVHQATACTIQAWQCVRDAVTDRFSACQHEITDRFSACQHQIKDNASDALSSSTSGKSLWQMMPRLPRRVQHLASERPRIRIQPPCGHHRVHLLHLRSNIIPTCHAVQLSFPRLTNPPKKTETIQSGFVQPRTRIQNKTKCAHRTP